VFDRDIRCCNVSGSAGIKLQTVNTQQLDILRQATVSIPTGRSILQVYKKNLFRCV